MKNKPQYVKYVWTSGEWAIWATWENIKKPQCICLKTSDKYFYPKHYYTKAGNYGASLKTTQHGLNKTQLVESELFLELL